MIYDMKVHSACFLLFEVNVKSKLHDENERHSILKVPVFGLMAKGVHS